MTAPLGPESFVECPVHGRQPPAFMCRHLQEGEASGFFQPDDRPGPDDPWQQAWCAKCEGVREREGEWNDVSENFAQVQLVCSACFKNQKARNASPWEERPQAVGWLTRITRIFGQP